MRKFNALLLLVTWGIVIGWYLVSPGVAWLLRPAPVVYVDALSHKCVRAEGPGGPIPCDKLPEQYDRVTVAPAAWTKREEGTP